MINRKGEADSNPAGGTSLAARVDDVQHISECAQVPADKLHGKHSCCKAASATTDNMQLWMLSYCPSIFLQKAEHGYLCVLRMWCLLKHGVGTTAAASLKSSPTDMQCEVVHALVCCLCAQVPPEAWGGNIITLPEVTQRANFARDHAGGAQYGIMLCKSPHTTVDACLQAPCCTVCSGSAKLLALRRLPVLSYLSYGRNTSIVSDITLLCVE